MRPPSDVNVDLLSRLLEYPIVTIVNPQWTLSSPCRCGSFLKFEMHFSANMIKYDQCIARYTSMIRFFWSPDLCQFVYSWNSENPDKQQFIVSRVFLFFISHFWFFGTKSNDLGKLRHGSKPCSPGKHQNSWDLWNFIPLKMVSVYIYIYINKYVYIYINKYVYIYIYTPSLLDEILHR